ncbi:sulfite exporter TauE/SafE family protein [Piscinibacter sakaiensis]|uniref:sulfite exporter TauE/SafE family protein n=1 Tax=Piscinibacter sakaiensis TaxID=1547922 RepID=UPI003AABAA1B
MITSLLLGVLVGAVLGLTGAGGGILAVPALVVGLGWTMQQAAPVALIAVAAGAAVGALEGFRHGLVRYKAAILMAITGAASTTLGLQAAKLMSQQVLLLLFSAVMLFVAVRMFLQARRDEPDDDSSRWVVAHLSDETGRLIWNWPTAGALAGIGVVTGVMTGLLGVGGGFVIVPLLRRFTDVGMKCIVATSLLTIALVGAGGVANAVLQGADLPLKTTLQFSGAMIVGMLIGRVVSQRVSSTVVQTGFSVVLFLVALGLIGKALIGD